MESRTTPRENSPPPMVAVIMAGGAGTRFWPLSTNEKPKQFLTLFGQRSLLQQSYDRLADLIPPQQVLVLTHESFVPIVRDQLPELPPENVLGEPMRKDTAAAITLAAYLCRKRYGNPVMAVLTADHLIEPAEQFRATLLSAARAASTGPFLYTFGVPPTRPATGYGYLEKGDRVQMDEGGLEHFALKGFKEKPDQDTARQYLQSGDYLWNSGLFVWQTDTICQELERHLPLHVRHLMPVSTFDGSPAWPILLREAFKAVPPISIDYGVMEKASHVRMVAAPFSWSDVGGWVSLAPMLSQDDHGNSHRGHLESHGAVNNVVFCEDPEERVALVGVKDLVVVRCGKQTLVVPKDRAEEVKALATRLAAQAHQ